jgi:uncharacterized membrane protein YphA (DoxX/SURF4 family)
MKFLLRISRVIVGVLFIFSGLVKANDPMGLSYKMQEFFEVWNIHWLDQYALVFSIGMIVFEIIAGVAVLLGWQMKLFSWLLLLLILFFSFLTGYAYLSGKIRECGCFGDCLPLTAGESFAKDLLLMMLILFLFANREKIKPYFNPVTNIALLIIGTVFSFSLQWYVLLHLPVLDCLPFKRGSNIPEKMKAAPGSVPDSTVISFVYNKDGKEIEFTSDKFPAGFDDSYKFVKRYDKLIRKGNAEPPIKDFVLSSSQGTDSTQAILDQKGYKLFLFIKTFDQPNPDWAKEFSVIYTYARSKNIPVYFISSDYENVGNWLHKLGLDHETCLLKCDATALKTAARVDPTLYLLKRGTILEKWSHADFDQAILEMNALPVQQPEEHH